MIWNMLLLAGVVAAWVILNRWFLPNLAFAPECPLHVGSGIPPIRTLRTPQNPERGPGQMRRPTGTSHCDAVPNSTARSFSRPRRRYSGLAYRDRLKRLRRLEAR